MAAAKRRRLQELLGLGGVSDQALSDILERLRAEPVEGNVSRHTCNRAARDSIEDVKETTQLPLVKGGQVKWTYLNPQKLLNKCIGRSPMLASGYEAALQDHPNSSESPWGLIVYFDELTPGNVLRLDNKRKTMAIYMSFAQLGHHRLCKTELWLTIAVARTSFIKTIAGGWSNMLRVLLRSAFLGADSFQNGVVVHTRGPRFIFARLSNVIADEAALKLGLDCKGASGLRPCPMCKNVMLKGSEVANRDRTGYLVEITCSDMDRFDWASDRDLFDVADLLQSSRGTMGVGAFKQLEMSTGFNHNERGILADTELRPFLRPASSFTFDPMHCLWSNGIVSVEVHCFLQRLREQTQFSWRDIQMFCKADWQFPSFCRAKGRCIHEVFNEVRERFSKYAFKAGATEMLVVLPLLLHFGETWVAAALPREIESLRALAVVAHETQEAKFQRGDLGRMTAAITHHFALFRKNIQRRVGEAEASLCLPFDKTNGERWVSLRCFHIGEKTPTGEDSCFQHGQHSRLRNLSAIASAHRRAQNTSRRSCHGRATRSSS